MKRLIIFIFIALAACFAVDMFADTGFTDILKGGYMTASTSGPLIAMGAAAVVAETPEQLLNKTKLWVISQSEFDDLQVKYRHLYILDITFSQDEKYQFIARRPSKEVIQAIGETKDNPFKIADLMIKNMIVAGDINDLNDGVVYSRMIELLTGIVKDGKKLFTKA